MFIKFKGPILSLLAVILLITGTSLSPVKVATDDPWTAGQLMSPQILATLISNFKGTDVPVIFNIGSVNTIKGAITIGPAGKDDGISLLAEKLKNVPKDRFIVIYCGCCPLFKCPNVRPAFNDLVKEGYTNIKVLNLATNLKTDWIDKGYPVEADNK
ncbi:MAG TPA: hypothetical protein VK541_07140 [Pedobacter sp.]|uniref:rhodanese-like domain-containing protein n=1 Tax=Pedobacter sp. TaxID=1411316 RepID=UPI002BD91C63|nr:rhodanese-like domain-containing protein [Pedobacter sp.]HMI02238.1 hypothetical protein [Pedobacter sp.]